VTLGNPKVMVFYLALVPNLIDVAAITLLGFAELAAVLLGVLAWFLQSFSPNKLAGWGFFVLFLIATLAFDQAGLSDPIFHYGRYPGSPLPPVLTGETQAEAYRLLWGTVATVLAALGIARPAPSRVR